MHAAVTYGDDENALEAIRYGWGDAYEIGYDDEHGWYAGRRDQIGALITADAPDALLIGISADYALKPVPREPRTRERAGRRPCVMGADAGELLTESAEP